MHKKTKTKQKQNRNGFCLKCDCLDFQIFTRYKLVKIGAAFRANACLCEPIAMLRTKIETKLNTAVTSSKKPKLDIR